MIKKISDLTEKEKAAFFRASLDEMARNYGASKTVVKQKMQDELDRAYSDAGFARMNPDNRIDMAYLRRDFKKKPSLEDYLIWMTKFVTHSDSVEIPDESLDNI